MKNKQYKDLLVKLPRAIDNYGTLEISVNYTRGGLNYYDGNVDKKGFRVSLKPMNVITFADGSTTKECMLMGDQRRSGFYIFLKDANRFNKKTLDKLFDKVSRLADEIASQYSDGNYEIINRLLTN